MTPETPAAELRVLPRSSWSSFVLPPEMMAEAAWRLGSLGLIYSASGVFGFLARRVLLVIGGDLDPSVHVGDAVAGVSIVMGFGVYLLSRTGGFSARRLLGFGLVFEVVAAIGITASQFWSGEPGLPPTSLTLVSAECVWIV